MSGTILHRAAAFLVLAGPLAVATPTHGEERWSRINPDTMAREALILPVCTGPYQISSGDLNGDGFPDLVIPCRGELLSPTLPRPANDQLTVYLNPGASEGAWVRRDFTVGFGPYHSATGDLDGDGLQDVVVPNYHSNDGRDLSILYGSRDRAELLEDAVSVSFDDAQLINEYGLDNKGNPRYATPGLTSAVIADFNSDGRPDIVSVSYQSNVFYVLLNEGERRFRTARYPQQPAPYDMLLGGPRDIAVADYDGDGELDLAFSMYESNLIEVWRGDGQGGFSAWRRMPSHGRIPYHLKSGDLDQDGRPDIVVGNRSTSDNVVLLRNDADRFVYDGSFTLQTAKRGEVTADEIRDVELADLDGDGRLDLIATARESGKVALWRGTGETGFNSAFTERKNIEFPGRGPRGVTVAGRSLAVIFYNTSEVAVMDWPASQSQAIAR